MLAIAISMAEKLESKQEFEFIDIAEFQLLADEFCDAYFSLTGRDGMTNYLHLLKAGHFSWFLNTSMATFTGYLSRGGRMLMDDSRGSTSKTVRGVGVGAKGVNFFQCFIRL